MSDLVVALDCRPATQLLAQRGHAWLLAGPSGLGQYSLALALVRAWLCDAPSPHDCSRLHTMLVANIILSARWVFLQKLIFCRDFLKSFIISMVVKICSLLV